MRMTLEQAKVVAVQGARAELGRVQEALDVLFEGIRALEIEKEQRPRAATVPEAQVWVKLGRMEALKDLAVAVRMTRGGVIGAVEIMEKATALEAELNTKEISTK